MYHGIGFNYLYIVLSMLFTLVCMNMSDQQNENFPSLPSVWTIAPIFLNFRSENRLGIKMIWLWLHAFKWRVILQSDLIAKNFILRKIRSGKVALHVLQCNFSFPRKRKQLIKQNWITPLFPFVGYALH